MPVVVPVISENISRGRVEKLGAGLSLVFSTVPGRLQGASVSGAVVEIPRSGAVRVARALIESVVLLPLQPPQSVQDGHREAR